MYVDVSRLISEVAPFDLSASIAERGKNVGPETWANAKATATGTPLSIDADDRDVARKWFAEFGAWDRDEIAAWSAAGVDALILQFAAGDLREVQSLCPGDGLGDVDWIEAERMAEEGTVPGRLYPEGERLMIYIGN